MDHGEAEFLSVRETARWLGVHENTVRNWAREGILPTARIPGSRFHRFDARDVERLRRERGAAVSSIEAERRTILANLWTAPSSATGQPHGMPRTASRSWYAGSSPPLQGSPTSRSVRVKG